MLSASGHKLNGPKGIGFLYIRKGIKIRNLIHGGGQERARRAGTENVPGIVSFSTAPLRLSTYVGFLSSLISIIYLVVVVIQKLFFGIDVPGYATIVVLVLLLGGLQLFCLGVLGEYLAKMYIQVKNQ